MTAIYTIGHSTRGAQEFCDLLVEHAVERLVDVRQYPASRRYPHFAAEALAASLSAAGIEYAHYKQLGGRRRPAAESRNHYWQNASFRAYADYMATDEFQQALDELIGHAEHTAQAIMCAEAVPWRCHRWLISDALCARGISVVHILGTGQVKPHVLNPQAVVGERGRLTYPGLFAK